MKKFLAHREKGISQNNKGNYYYAKFWKDDETMPLRPKPKAKDSLLQSIRADNYTEFPRIREKIEPEDTSCWESCWCLWWPKPTSSYIVVVPKSSESNSSEEFIKPYKIEN